MLPKSRKFIIAGFFTVIFIFGLAQIALAVVPAQITSGLEATAREAKILRTSGNVTNLIGNIIGAMLSFVGVVFFALMVFGGFMWMTARGKEEQTKKAQSTMTSAVIGLVIVLSSYAITNFVFQNTYLTPPSASTTEEKGTVDPKDVACDTAHQGWTCNSIDMCSNTVGSTAVNCEENSGKNNCLVNGADGKTPLCTTTNQVCCQPKDESQKKYDWCFNLKTGICEKLDEVGIDHCPDQAERTEIAIVIKGDAQTLQIKDSTEIECLKNLRYVECKDDSICQTSKTGFVCAVPNTNSPNASKSCREPAEAEYSESCQSTKNCKTGVCKNIDPSSGIGTCTLLEINCKVNLQLGDLGCSPVVCGEKDADVVCTSDSQCASNHCVKGKCESGAERASCAKDGDCNDGLFCSSRPTTSCCQKKLEYGEKCYGMNNACVGEKPICDSKTGKCI